VALEVGIVGLPGAGKTTLFTALTKTGGGEYGKTNVGMAHVLDDRLDALARVVSAKKVTPAAIRVQDVPGTGPALLGALRQVDALLVVLDGHSPAADPARDLEDLKLELLVADRDHVERRLERVEKQAKSGDLKLRAEVEELRKVLAHADAGGTLAEYPGELTDEEAASFRDGGASALAEVVRRLRDALKLVTFFTAGEKETRAWTLHDGQSALEAAGTIHSDIARGFIRCEVIDWHDLVEAGSHAEASRRGLQRLEGKTYVVRDGDVLNIRFNV
jgi:ribosome-binding ATPase